MDAGIGSFGSSSVTPPAPVAATPERAPAPTPVAQPKPAAAPRAESESERKVAIDPETMSLVYSTIDVSSGLVVRQTPDDARLKLRAYIDSVASDAQAKPLVERVA